MILAHLWSWKVMAIKTWYELVNPKQDYDNAKFEKTRLNSVCEKASDQFFCQIKDHVIYLPWINLQKSKVVVYSRPAWCTKQSYKVST